MTLQPNPSGNVFSLQVFEPGFTPADWLAGQALQMQGQVEDLSHPPKVPSLLGKVQDGHQKFELQVTMHEKGFSSRCSCNHKSPLGTCRHASALIHQWLSPKLFLVQQEQVTLSAVDERQLQQILQAWKPGKTLHEAHLLKLRALHKRCPMAVEAYLEHENALELKQHLLQAVPNRTEHTRALRSSPLERAELQTEHLVFALDPGKPETHGHPARLIPMVGTLENERLERCRVFVPSKDPFIPRATETPLLNRVLKIRAHRELPLDMDTDLLLHELLLQKRIYLGDNWHHPLDAAQVRPGKPIWEMDEQGIQHPVFQVRPAARILPLDTVWFVDTMGLKMGQVETYLAAHHVRQFLHLTPVPPEGVRQLQKTLSLLPGKPLPLPATLPHLELQGKPVIHLDVQLKTVSWQGQKSTQVMAELSVEYLEKEARLEDLSRVFHARALPPVRTFTSEGWMVVRRDFWAEKKAQETLRDLGFHSTEEAEEGRLGYQFGLKGQVVPELQSRTFVTRGLQDLRDQGWQVTLAGQFATPIKKPTVAATIRETEEWFTLDLRVEVGGARVSLLPMLLNWMENHPYELNLLLEGKDTGQVEYFPVDGTGLIEVDLGRLRTVLGTLVEYYTPGSQQSVLRFPSMAALKLFEGGKTPDLEWQGEKKLLTLAKNLIQLSSGGKQVTLPEALNATLRPYQHEGVSWLQLLRKTGCSGILADDMGLGKTLQTLTHLLIEKEAGRLKKPALIVAPTSLMANWMSEAAKFTPTLNTLLLHGPHRHKGFDTLPDMDVVFTSYALLHRDLEKLKKHTFHTVVLDEAQNIKNVRSQTSQALSHLKSQHRLCLSGTPLENHLGELWSLFQFLMPGLLPRAASFRTTFREPIEKDGNTEKLQNLSDLIRPLMLRRTKKEVAKELPEKTEITVNLELHGEQRDLYETLRLATQHTLQEHLKEKGLEQASIHVLSALLRLRQVCCDPRLLHLDGARHMQTSAKMKWLRDTLPEMLEEGRTVLIFSQFTTLLGLLGETLKAQGVEFALLTGQTRDRQEQVRRFQSGEVKVFLISLKAGGVGLNLTAADTVIHFDPWWNPAAENQATDRAYRIGQEKPVFVYKLVTSGTIEEKILCLQRFKQELSSSILGGTLGEGLRFTEEDVQLLLSSP